jgi:D-inositol-3-phosphate glycosyltransferase
MREKIAFISEHASPLAILGGVDAGGQNVYVAELACELARRNYHIDIFTRRSDPSIPEVVEYCPNVNVVHIKAGPEKDIAKELMLQHMNEFTIGVLHFIGKTESNYSLIHANFFMSALVASHIKQIMHIPYVVTFHALGAVRQMHQQERDRFPPERIDIEKAIVQDADLIIAECPQDRDDLIRHYDAPASRIAIVQCGVNPSEFYPINKKEAREKLHLSASEFILLQVGRMVPRKGIDNVIRALSRLHHRVKLLIVGGEAEQRAIMNTSEARRLYEVAKVEHVCDHVEFTGRKCRSELKYYYAAADVFITTPWYEPFGITPLESMACGTPVIGANVGGIKYSVADGRTGLLVPPNDPGKLATAIDRCLDNPSLLRSMSAEAITRVNKLFTWRYVASSLDQLYKGVIASHIYETIAKKYEFAA